MKDLLNRNQIGFIEQVIKYQGIPGWVKILLVAWAIFWHQSPDPVLGQVDDMLMYIAALTALSTKANVWVLKKRTQWAEWRQRRRDQRLQRKIERG